MVVTGIPHDKVLSMWPQVLPVLEKVLKKRECDHDADDILSCLLDRSMQLWVCLEEESVEAVLITSIGAYPKRKICQLLYLAGRGYKDWLQAQSTIERWAKAQGCTHIEGYMRDGWLRVLKDWNKSWVTMRKAL